MEGTPPPDSSGQSYSPIPMLKVDMVLRTFENARKIITPEVNIKLAHPFKKAEIEDRSEFKSAYISAKNYVSRVSGQFSGEKKEEVQRRRSLPFDWPKTKGSLNPNQTKPNQIEI